MRPNQQNPAVAAQIQQAVALHQRGDLDGAETLYKKVLAKTPRHFQALYLLGMLELHRDNRPAALELIDGALKINPTHVDAQFDRATILEDMERDAEALRGYDLVLALKPDFADALFRRGNVLRKMERLMEALDCYKRVLASKPDHAEAWFKQGNTLHDLDRIDEALASYERAVAVAPEYPEALFNLGNTQKDLDLFEDALATYEKALAIEPDFAEAIANHAYVLYALNRLDQALAGYDRALALMPEDTGTLFNRGSTLEDMQRYGEAIESYAKAQEIDPDFVSAHWNESLCRLRLGDFDAGWPKYEQRWETEQLQEHRRRFSQPLWLGKESLLGKTILLHAEQGFGDTLQFARYVPLIVARGARVILEVQAPLKTLMAQIKGVSTVIRAGEPLPPFDFHCPLISLPLACSTISVQDIPTQRYLWADAAKSADWQSRLGPKNKLRVGLVWSGNPRADNPAARRLDALRSMPFATLAPLVENDAVEFHSLQVGDNAVSQLKTHPLGRLVADHARDLRDFADTAALIDNLDLVISVDTAVAHLAGSLGKPVWLLNRYNTCWRWLLERTDSPWYPSMRIFRQDKLGDWSNVISDVQNALRQTVQH
ncbi:tetratricopeptide repeat protein [Herbaspirillum sp. RV1423]|uniref:tetratricopeptide repeat protein n=1 Tax=Herbaspirillum sp. RV1423 TaxID=1443993 RepID=UPI0004B47913|nr:tetratricopeptide repeat protein [Herbaspirillum sp. RV1423]